MAKRGNLKKVHEKESEDRPVRFRRYQYLFLIVCEDGNTEPKYFGHFKSQIPDETIFLRPVGAGRDSKGVVEQAIKERQKLSVEAKKEVDVVWAVFDKDDADKNVAITKRFEDAFEIAKASDIKTAYSNEAFELWLLLHLTDVDSSISLPRADINRLLQDNVRNNQAYSTFAYEHGNENILEIIYEIGNQAAAIDRAALLLQKQGKKKPIEANPSTKVHLLVKELLELITYFSYEPDA